MRTAGFALLFLAASPGGAQTVLRLAPETPAFLAPAPVPSIVAAPALAAAPLLGSAALAAPAPLALAALSAEPLPAAAVAAAPASALFAAPAAAVAPAEAAPAGAAAFAASPAREGAEAQVSAARQRFDGAGAPGAPDAAGALTTALVSGDASPEFVAAVRAQVARSFPPAVQRDLLKAGYRVEVVKNLRDGRPDLDASEDFVSGYHAHEPGGNVVRIGENVKIPGTERWEKSASWQNAVDHEVGLALARVLGDAEAARVADSDPRQAEWYRQSGLAESPGLREAWRQDFQSIPDELKDDKEHDGTPNDFYYFLRPDKNGWFQKARQLTFAEGLDVLLRGPHDAYNHENFSVYFPRTLAEIRRELEARYGWSPRPASAPEIAAPKLWSDPSATPAQLASTLVTGGASPAFLAKIRAYAAGLPTPILRDLMKAGYRIEANRSVRQGREHLHEDNDLTGGFHSHGPVDRYIVIAEKIRLRESGEWVDSAVWENAINHEIGHALAYIQGEIEAERLKDSQPQQALWYRKKGLSESPGFREAWREDYRAIPDELKQEWVDSLTNNLYYFVHADPGGWYQRARQETFAEGFDVLRRGPRSTFNYDNFTRRFPRALAEIRRELEARYGPIFPPEPAPARPSGALEQGKSAVAPPALARF
jgi:hypothetical protein